ncbi:MAG TPA: RDD family protein [Kineosporiaceae bacterium]|nr:RDD family protein [Kineosporiaceae bacterium]
MNEPTRAPDGPADSQPFPAPEPPAPRGQPVQPYGQPAQPYAQPPPPWGTPTGFAPESAVQPYGYLTYPAPGQGLRLVTPGGRLGAALLDGLLYLLTLGIGWLIWMLITWGSGQTPGKQLLHQVVVDPQTGQRFTWGRMCLREFVVRGLLFGLLSFLTLGVFSLVDALMVFREDRRTLHDQVSGSIVCYL